MIWLETNTRTHNNGAICMYHLGFDGYEKFPNRSLKEFYGV